MAKRLPIDESLGDLYTIIMLTRLEGVKNPENGDDVICAWPLMRERYAEKGLALNEGECYRREWCSGMQLRAHFLIKGKLYVV